MTRQPSVAAEIQAIHGREAGRDASLVAQTLAQVRDLFQGAGDNGRNPVRLLASCLQMLRETLLRVTPAWRSDSVRITPIPAAGLAGNSVTLFGPGALLGDVMAPPEVTEGEVGRMLQALHALAGAERALAAAALLGIQKVLQHFQTDGVRALLDPEQSLAWRIEICMPPPRAPALT